MIERLFTATHIVILGAVIVLVVFLPVRWLVMRKLPADKLQQPVPAKIIALSIGGPIAIIYAFAIHPILGMIGLGTAMVSALVSEFNFFRQMTGEDKQKMEEIRRDTMQKPLGKALRAVQVVAFVYLVYLIFSEYIL